MRHEAKQPDDWVRFLTMSQLGACAGRPKKVRRGRAALARRLRRHESPRDEDSACAKDGTGRGRMQLVACYEAWGKAEQAEALRVKPGPPAGTGGAGVSP